MKKKAMIILAEGFEETEAIAPVDVLKRAEVDVTIYGLSSATVTGGHGISIETDIVFENMPDELSDAVLFPGGSPGSENLASSSKVKDLILKMNKADRLVCAICASPALVLDPTGILDGRQATCYPGLEKNFSSQVRFSKDRVVKDGNIITSRGPGTALEFGYKIAAELVGQEKADMLAEIMVHSG